MEWLRPRALLTASRIWRAADGEPWLVTLAFAEVDGRLECVGMEIRSYLGEACEDEFGAYPAYVIGEMTRDDIIPPRPNLPDLELTDPESRRAYLQAVEDWEIPPTKPALGDTEAVDAVLHDSGEGWRPGAAPRPLRTATLRALPLGDLLARVRRDVADAWRSGVAAPRPAASLKRDQALEDLLGEETAERVPPSAARRELERRTWAHLTKVRERHGWDDELIRERDELSRMHAVLDELDPRQEAEAQKPQRWRLEIDAAEFQRLTQQASSAFAAPGQKAGRPTQHSRAQLELVARTYQRAYESGSPSPTKDVAKELGLTRARAAKLVMRCRDPRVGLLGPTQARHAGGIEPGAAASPEAGGKA